MISSYVVDLLGFNERMATSSIIFTSGAVLLQTAMPFYLLTKCNLTNFIGSASGYKLTTIVTCFTNEANDNAKSQVRHKTEIILSGNGHKSPHQFSGIRDLVLYVLWMQLIAITIHQVLVGQCIEGDVRTLTRN